MTSEGLDVIIDGRRVPPAAAVISVFDEGLLRGDGCFETLKSYDGWLFAREEHIDRLEASAAALRLPMPERSQLESWLDQIAADVGDGFVRVVLTRGVPDEPGRTIVLGGSFETPGTVSLYPVVAPWHGAGVPWELAGAKTISYAPNRAATRSAIEHGHDDALLLSREGHVLEGPTFAVAWFRSGVLETPTLSLGVLDSITRRTATAAAEHVGVGVEEVVADLERLYAADEVVALSTIKEVTPVIRLGERPLNTGPMAPALQKAFIEIVMSSRASS